MKCLIVYDTKYGTTEKVCSMLSDVIKEKIDVTIDMIRASELLQIQERLEDYRIIIVASPLYYGRLLDSITDFINNNKELLKSNFFVFIGIHIFPGHVERVLKKFPIQPDYYYSIFGVIEMGRLHDVDKRVAYSVIPKHIGRKPSPDEVIGEILPDEIKKCAQGIIATFEEKFTKGFIESMVGIFDQKAAMDKNIIFNIVFKDLKISYSLIVENGTCTVEKNSTRKPHLSWIADSDIFLKIREGKIDSSEAYIAGDIESEGDTSFIYDFFLLFPYTEEIPETLTRMR